MVLHEWPQSRMMDEGLAQWAVQKSKRDGRAWKPSLDLFHEAMIVKVMPTVKSHTGSLRQGFAVTDIAVLLSTNCSGLVLAHHARKMIALLPHSTAQVPTLQFCRASLITPPLAGFLHTAVKQRLRNPFAIRHEISVGIISIQLHTTKSTLSRILVHCKRFAGISIVVGRVAALPTKHSVTTAATKAVSTHMCTCLNRQGIAIHAHRRKNVSGGGLLYPFENGITLLIGTLQKIARRGKVHDTLIHVPLQLLRPNKLLQL